VDSPQITTPHDLAEFLLNGTNLNEAPEGTVMVIDLDVNTHQITKLGHSGGQETSPNIVLQFCEDNLEQNEGRVILVPTSWVKDSHTKDILSILAHKDSILDVLAIDCERRVYYSALCSGDECCPPDGNPIESRG
jgi:hypothetical protein